jgi:hypothetical protein
MKWKQNTSIDTKIISKQIIYWTIW